MNEGQSPEIEASGDPAVDAALALLAAGVAGREGARCEASDGSGDRAEDGV